MVQRQHRAVGAQHLHQYAADAAWKEDYRRLDNGKLANRKLAQRSRIRSAGCGRDIGALGGFQSAMEPKELVGRMARGSFRARVPDDCASVWQSGACAAPDGPRAPYFNEPASPDFRRTRPHRDDPGLGGAGEPRRQAVGEPGHSAPFHHRHRICLWLQRQRPLHPRLRSPQGHGAVAVAQAGGMTRN